MLALDGVSILIDGVSREGTAYPATSAQMQDALIASKPDVLCISHSHPDHFDASFAHRYKDELGGTIIGPIDKKEFGAVRQPVQIGNVKITPIETRHIGKVGINVDHTSFILEGTSCIWFLGDAAVLQWKNCHDIPKPDVLIVPFAYVNTATSWEITKNLGADTVVVVHMPHREDDPYQLWESVCAVTAHSDHPKVYIPELGQSIII